MHRHDASPLPFHLRRRVWVCVSLDAGLLRALPSPPAQLQLLPTPRRSPESTEGARLFAGHELRPPPRDFGAAPASLLLVSGAADAMLGCRLGARIAVRSRLSSVTIAGASSDQASLAGPLF